METDKQSPADRDLHSQATDSDGVALITGKITVKGGKFYARDKVVDRKRPSGSGMQIAVVNEGGTASTQSMELLCLYKVCWHCSTRPQW